MSDMTDKELIELAAKAAGLHVKVASNSGRGLKVHGNCNWWNPLTNDGDALRLAVKLNLHVRMWVYACEVENIEGDQFGMNHFGDFDCDAMSVTRHAITRAAAQIGKEME